MGNILYSYKLLINIIITLNKRDYNVIKDVFI